MNGPCLNVLVSMQEVFKSKEDLFEEGSEFGVKSKSTPVFQIS